MILIIDPVILAAYHQHSSVHIFIRELVSRLDSYTFAIDGNAINSVLKRAYGRYIDSVDEEKRETDLSVKFALYLMNNPIEVILESGGCIYLTSEENTETNRLFRVGLVDDVIEKTMIQMSWDGIFNRNKDVTIILAGEDENIKHNNRSLYEKYFLNQVDIKLRAESGGNSHMISICHAINTTVRLPFEYGSLVYLGHPA